MRTRTSTNQNVAIAGLVVIPLYYAAAWAGWLPESLEPRPIINGLLLLLFVYAAYVAATDDLRIWNASVGADGRASTSKFQPFLWTIVVLFSFVVVTSVRLEADPQSIPPDIPPNVLIVLGLAFGVGLGAKAITVNKVSTGREVRDITSGKGALPLFQTDDGYADLYKIQTLAFTFIAIGIYLTQTVAVVEDGGATSDLPDIPDGLLFVMGISSAAYLGKKLSGSQVTHLTSIDPSEVSRQGDKAARTITITGVNFGPSQGASQIAVGGTTLETPATAWTDTEVKVEIPKAKPDGGEWPEVPLEVRVVAGTPSVNAKHLTIKA